MESVQKSNKSKIVGGRRFREICVRMVVISTFLFSSRPNRTKIGITSVLPVVENMSKIRRLVRTDLECVNLMCNCYSNSLPIFKLSGSERVKYEGRRKLRREMFLEVQNIVNSL